MIDFIHPVITKTILVYFFFLNTFYVIFIAISLYEIFRYRNLITFLNFKEIFRLPLLKPVSIISPAFNEENNIIESIKSLLSLEYPLYEVIVVNDGSTDSTLEKLIKTFKLKKSFKVFRKSIETKPIRGVYTSPLHPKLIVIDKINGKKADALNAGLNIARYPLFCTIDADSILNKDSLFKIVRPFLENPKTVGAGGIIYLSNDCTIKSGEVIKVRLPRNWLSKFQILEYLRAFLGGRIGLSALRCILIISGAFGIFRKDIALECGGYRTNTIGEDMDLVVRMRKYLHEKKVPFLIHFIPDPICWTEGPETIKALARQRNRWHRGLIESLIHSRKMLFNLRYGITGMVAMPFYFIFEMLGPLIEFIGYTLFIFYIVSGRINYPFALTFFTLAIIYGIFLSLMAILLEELSHFRYPAVSNLFIISIFSFLENILYRQFLTAVRVKAFIDFIFRKKEWGELKKKGFLSD
ncbi:MAG: glycosyltransferase [Acidobacteriota bacterium]|nr:glycosyltransferase [Acidobacteriota bacterium]